MSRSKSLALIMLAAVILVEGLFYIYGADWLKIDEKFSEEMGDAASFVRLPSFAFEDRVLKLMGLTFVVGILIVFALPKKKTD